MAPEQSTASTAATPYGRYERRGLLLGNTDALIHRPSHAAPRRAPNPKYMAMGGQLGMKAFPYDELSALAPWPPQWGPRLERILRGLLPPKPRVRGPSGNDFHSVEAYMQAQNEFKAASLKEKAAYKVWFKSVGSTAASLSGAVVRNV